MSSLLEGIDIKPQGYKGQAAKTDDDRKRVKIAIVVVCFVLAGALMAWNFGLFDSTPASGGSADAGPADPAAPVAAAPVPRPPMPKITDPPTNSSPGSPPGQFLAR